MTTGLATFVVDSANLMAAPGTTFALSPNPPIATNLRFVPLFVHVHLRTMTGPALTTAPAIKIGTNAAHNNVAPLFSPPLGVAVNAIASIPLASPLAAPQIGTAAMLVELATAAVGPTAMTGDVMVTGLLIGP
jgi:hypothetical protein